ncbi:MAG: hypothetical protein K0S34_655 [Bacillales bacterium]|jgi:hypothetical protein|nr:hypothetical protein [Bacillales bacterium]
MKKVFIGFLFFLIIISSILTYVQWIDFQEQKIISKTVEGVQSEAKISSYNNVLNINQSFNIKDGNSFELLIPLGAKDIKCTYENKKACKSYTQANKLVVNISKNKQFKIIYKLLVNPKQNEIMVKKPFFSPTKNTDIVFKFDLIENYRLKGDWISGGETIAVSKKETLNLFKFKSGNLDLSLFYSNNPIRKINNQDNVYTTSTNEIPELVGIIKKVVPQKTKINYLITSNKGQNYYSKHLVILANTDNHDIVLNNYIRSYLLDSWQFDNNTQSYSLNVLSGLIINSSSNQKIKSILGSWNNAFDEKTKRKILNDLFKNDNRLFNSKLIDYSIKKITGDNSNFFELNERSKDFIPYYAYYDQPVFVNKIKVKQKAIKLDNNVTVPVNIIENFGFIVKEVNNKLVITSNSNKWEFTGTKKVFTFNNEYYEADEIPIVKIEGNYYISDIWIDKLFKIRITLKKDMIIINRH